MSDCKLARQCTMVVILGKQIINSSLELDGISIQALIVPSIHTQICIQVWSLNKLTLN